MLRQKLEGALARSGRRRASPADRAVVLCYHSVHPTKSIASVTPAVFEEHLRWLVGECEVVPLGSAFARPPGRHPEKPLVVVTFDDGYRDNYTHAFPALARHGIPATFFITTGLVEGDPGVIRRFSTLGGAGGDDVEGLTWSQVGEMRAAGMEFGDHTYSHRNLSTVSKSEATAEIKRSRDLIEDHLQEPIRYFAYPFGRPRRHFSEETVELLKELGFSGATTVEFRGLRPKDNMLKVPRIPVAQDSVELLMAKVLGRLDVLAKWEQLIPQTLFRILFQNPERGVTD